MDLLQLLNDLLFDYTLRTVALGAAAVGIVSGGLGSFAVLRRQSLLGDAITKLLSSFDGMQRMIQEQSNAAMEATVGHKGEGDEDISIEHSLSEASDS